VLVVEVDVDADVLVDEPDVVDVDVDGEVVDDDDGFVVPVVCSVVGELPDA
jgi:hypothetical protein